MPQSTASLDPNWGERGRRSARGRAPAFFSRPKNSIRTTGEDRGHATGSIDGGKTKSRKGTGLTYSDLVGKYASLSWTEDDALRAWRRWKDLDAPKNYRAWLKFRKGGITEANETE